VRRALSPSQPSLSHLQGKRLRLPVDQALRRAMSPPNLAASCANCVCERTCPRNFVSHCDTAPWLQPKAFRRAPPPHSRPFAPIRGQLLPLFQRIRTATQRGGYKIDGKRCACPATPPQLSPNRNSKTENRNFLASNPAPERPIHQKEKAAEDLSPAALLILFWILGFGLWNLRRPLGDGDDYPIPSESSVGSSITAVTVIELSL
jgi:hypothetical protein